MSKPFILIAAIVLLTLMTGCTVSLNVADQNFESARRNRLRGNEQTAQQDYRKAATAYEQSFATKHKDGDTPFLSSRLKAGMSFYWSGQTQKALDLFTSLYNAKDRSLETIIYGGLAAARLGDRDKAIMFWSSLGVRHEIYTLRQAVNKTLTELKDGSINIGQAHDTVQSALIRQDRRNVLQRASVQPSLTGAETCSGRFWWRYNENSCSADMKLKSSAW